MISRLFISAIFIAIGILILKYRNQILSWTGYFYWAQKYLGSGGTSLVIALVGAGCIFFGFSYPFGYVSLPSDIQISPQP